MLTALKVVSRVAFYTTAFVMGGIIGWANNSFDDWVEYHIKVKN